MPIDRVQAGEVEGGPVEGGEGGDIHVFFVDAGESSEPGDRLRGRGEGEVAVAGASATRGGEELGGGQAVGVGEVLEPGLDRLRRAWHYPHREGRGHGASGGGVRDPPGPVVRQEILGVTSRSLARVGVNGQATRALAGDSGH